MRRSLFNLAAAVSLLVSTYLLVVWSIAQYRLRVLSQSFPAGATVHVHDRYSGIGVGPVLVPMWLAMIASAALPT